MADDIVDVSPQPVPPREYLGDGLYAEFDGWQIRLWADTGDGINEVYLEPQVLVAFLGYVEKLKDYAKKLTGGSVAT